MSKGKNISTKKSAAQKKNNTLINKKKPNVLFYIIPVVMLTIIAFSNSLRNNFVYNFDDIMYTFSAGNAKALSAKAIGTIFSSYVAGIYHPITILSLAIETHFFGDGAFHYHFTNLLIHILNVLLVFRFIQLLTKRSEIAVIVALFFGIHPMHVESVAWISERKDVLYTLFFLASLITYLKYLRNDKKFKYLVYSLILFLLSLLSKSAAVCLAPMVVLIDYYLKRKFVLKTILEKIPYFLLALVFGIISIVSQSAAGATTALSDFNFHFSFFERIFLLSYSMMFYIIKVFAPFSLAAIHYYPATTGGSLPLEYYLAPLGIALIVFLIVKFKSIRNDLIFGFLFFLISIILVLQFIPVGYAIVAERYSYVPYIGLFFIAGKLYADFTDNKFGNFSKNRKNYILLFIAMVTVLYLFLTFEQNKVWKNDVTLFDNVVANNPEVGHCYWARGNGKFNANDIQGALSDYNMALQLNYKNADAYNSRAKCYFEMDSVNAAIDGYTEALKLDNKHALAYYNRGHAKQKIMDYAGSVDDYKKAIENNVVNPGYVYNEMCYSQMNMNDLLNALISADKAIMLDPDYASEYIINKAKIEYLLKDYQASLKDYNKALDRNPNSDLALYGQGMVMIALKDSTAACSDFSKAAGLGYSKANDALKLYCNH